VEDSEKALPHLARFLAGINTSPNASVLVIITDGGGLCVVGRETLLQGLSIVIRTLDQGLAGDIILHLILGGIEDLVV